MFGQGTYLLTVIRRHTANRYFNFKYLLCVFYSFIAGLPVGTLAAEWDFSPALTIDEVYTDNVNLAPSGFREDDLISVITPGISVGRESSNLKFKFDYSLQNTLYAGDGDRNQHNHALNTDTSAILLDDHFFLDFSLARSVQNVTNTGAIAADNLNVSGDRGAILNYQIAPYWKQRIGKFANLDVRYTRDKISSSRTFGSRADDFIVSLSSGSNYNRLLFDLQFENSKITNESLRSTRTRRYNLNLRYLLTRKLAITSNIGYDDNEFDSSRNSIDEVIWNFGFEWNPSTRTSLSVSYGERFFGNDLKIFLSHRGRKIETSIRYERSPSSTRESFLQQQAFNLTDLFGNPLDNVINPQIADLNLAVREQTNEILIRSKLVALVSYRLKKHAINLSADYDKSEFEISGLTEYIRNINLDWSWNLFPSTSSNFRITWTKNNLRGDRNDTFLILQYGLSHRLTESLTGNIGLRYLDRKSDRVLSEYDESRIFANISKSF